MASKKKTIEETAVEEPAPVFPNRIMVMLNLKAKEIRPHPLNFRRHSDFQRGALAESLKRRGITKPLIIFDSEIYGPNTLVDGECRKDVDPEAVWPCAKLDINDEQAMELLATMDAIGELADVDTRSLQHLISDMQLDPHLTEMLEELLATDESSSGKETKTPDDQSGVNDKTQFKLVIYCKDEDNQRELLERMEGEGYHCEILMF